MHDTRPGFFLHSGDNIYADGPIAAELKVADGTIWKNLVTEAVAKVAETLAEYRGRYKYNLLDNKVRDLYADVPLIAQWDDHETLNNWYPGATLTDDRYTEKRVDVLASRAKKAFPERAGHHDRPAHRGSHGLAAQPVRHGPVDQGHHPGPPMRAPVVLTWLRRLCGRPPTGAGEYDVGPRPTYELLLKVAMPG